MHMRDSPAVHIPCAAGSKRRSESRCRPARRSHPSPSAQRAARWSEHSGSATETYRIGAAHRIMLPKIGRSSTPKRICISPRWAALPNRAVTLLLQPPAATQCRTVPRSPLSRRASSRSVWTCLVQWTASEMIQRGGRAQGRAEEGFFVLLLVLHGAGCTCAAGSLLAAPAQPLA